MENTPQYFSKPEDFLAELFEGPISKQRQNWLEQVKEVFADLMSAKVDLGVAKENPTFIDIFTNTTALAVRTHEQEKIDAFKNALYNTAIRPEEYDVTGIIFLNLLGSFTVWLSDCYICLKILVNGSKAITGPSPITLWAVYGR